MILMLKDGQTFQSFFLYWMEMQLLRKCRYKANALSLGTSNCKKGTWPIWIAHIKQKSSVTLAIVSKNNSRAVCCVGAKLKESVQEQVHNQINPTVTIRTRVLSTEWTTTKSIPLLRPEHGFCQQSGPERG